MDEIDIAVIGGGAAGIAAARHLHEAGKRVLLLEASQRLGGRAHTETIAGLPLDLGCGWLHSGDRNPWTTIAEHAGFTVGRGPTAWGEQYRNLGFPPEEAEAAWAAFQAFGKRLRTAPPASDRAADALEQGGPWNAYLQALSGYMNGVELDRLSVADYLAYEDAATDCNWRVEEGYGTLVAAHAAGIPCRLATPVTAIETSGTRLGIETPRGRLTAAKAIVATSTMVLARGAIDLGACGTDHLHAAAQLPLGLADKVWLALARPETLDVESHLIGDPHRAETGSYYIRPLGRPVIECFFGGIGARALERAGTDGMAAFAIDQLAALLGNDFRREVRVLAASNWGAQTWIGGSYSHALPGCHAARSTLAASIDGRLFVAGEATHDTDFSTAHGAYESGLRAAREALA